MTEVRPRGFLAAVKDSARASAGEGPHGAHAHTRMRVEKRPGTSPWAKFYRQQIRRLGPKAKARLKDRCDVFYDLAMEDPHRAVLLTGQFVAAELKKLHGENPEQAQQLRVETARKLVGLAIEVAGYLPGHGPHGDEEDDVDAM